MKKKNIGILILCIVIGLPLILSISLLGKNKCFHTAYEQLNDTDKQMLAEYNKLYEAFQEEKPWKAFDLENQATPCFKYN